MVLAHVGVFEEGTFSFIYLFIYFNKIRLCSITATFIGVSEQTLYIQLVQ